MHYHAHFYCYTYRLQFLSIKLQIIKCTCTDSVPRSCSCLSIIYYMHARVHTVYSSSPLRYKLLMYTFTDSVPQLSVYNICMCMYTSLYYFLPSEPELLLISPLGSGSHLPFSVSDLIRRILNSKETADSAWDRLIKLHATSPDMHIFNSYNNAIQRKVIQ